jgi:hypothetical protein
MKIRRVINERVAIDLLVYIFCRYIKFKRAIKEKTLNKATKGVVL